MTPKPMRTLTAAVALLLLPAMGHADSLLNSPPGAAARLMQEPITSSPVRKIQPEIVNTPEMVTDYFAAAPTSELDRITRLFMARQEAMLTAEGAPIQRQVQFERALEISYKMLRTFGDHQACLTNSVVQYMLHDVDNSDAIERCKITPPELLGAIHSLVTTTVQYRHVGHPWADANCYPTQRSIGCAYTVNGYRVAMEWYSDYPVGAR